MERETFTDPEVQSILRDFIAIKVDLTDTDDADAAAQRFGVVGDPTTLIIRSFDTYPPAGSSWYDARPHDLYRTETFVAAPDLARALDGAKRRGDRE